mgnify:CR=1 FL=1
MGKIRLREIQGTKLGQKTRQLAGGKLKSLQIIRTTGHLSETLREKNISELDIEDILEKDNETEEQDIETTEDTLGESDVGEEDEDIDHDEIRVSDPFDIEHTGKIKRGRYIAEVPINEKGTCLSHSIKFSQIPIYETDDNLNRNTLFERFKLFHKMASFIAQKQSGYFLHPQETNLINLNQKDLVNYLQEYSISKEHVSRMLNALYFRVQGIGDIPSKYLFERYGKIELSKDKLFKLAEIFLGSVANANRGKKFTRLHEAKAFRKFVKKEADCEIELSNNPNEHDRYKNIKNILHRARKAFLT